MGGSTGRDPALEDPRIRYVPIDDRVDRYADRAVGVVTSSAARRHEYHRQTYHLAYLLRAARAVRGNDIVVVHEFPQWIPWLRRIVPGARIVLWGGADSFIEVDHLLPDVRAADALVGASGSIVERFCARVPELAPASYTVYSGVDTDRFVPAPERVVGDRIVYAGRVTPEKGVHVLVDAFRMLADHRPDLELVLAGPRWVTSPSMLQGTPPEHVAEVVELATGDYATELERRAGPHRDRVRFTGGLPGAELIELMQTATVFCHPGLVEEGFGTVVAEALACGTPVVISDRGGPPEYVVDPDCGHVVPSGDAEALATALASIVDHPQRRPELAARAREVACATLSVDRSAEALAEVLDAVRRPEARPDG